MENKEVLQQAAEPIVLIPEDVGEEPVPLVNVENTPPSRVEEDLFMADEEVQPTIGGEEVSSANSTPVLPAIDDHFPAAVDVEAIPPPGIDPVPPVVEDPVPLAVDDPVPGVPQTAGDPVPAAADNDGAVPPAVNDPVPGVPPATQGAPVVFYLGGSDSSDTDDGTVPAADDNGSVPPPAVEDPVPGGVPPPAVEDPVPGGVPRPAVEDPVPAVAADDGAVIPPAQGAPIVFYLGGSDSSDSDDGAIPPAVDDPDGAIPQAVDDPDDAIPQAVDDPDDAAEQRERPANWQYRSGDVDSCEESPDEELLSRGDPVVRDLNADVIHDNINSSLILANLSLHDYDAHVISEEDLRNRVDIYARQYERQFLNRTEIDLYFAQYMNYHLSVYRRVGSRWGPGFARLLDMIEEIRDMRRYLMNKLNDLENGHLYLNEVGEIYDTIEHLDGRVKYADALLKRVRQRGEVLVRNSRKMKNMFTR